jgi:urate oxidase
MGARLVDDRYGKERIRVVRVDRGRTPHAVSDLSVDVMLEGEFDAAYVDGDNALVLPTDTMKNTVYALAADGPIGAIETFAIRLARRFLGTAAPIERATVRVIERPWSPIAIDGPPHDAAFHRTGTESPTCEVAAEPGPRGEPRFAVESGIEGLVVLKTARSAFAGFLHDDLTTLPDTHDRLLATRVRARWRWSRSDADFAGQRAVVRAALLVAFAEHDSRSVQHTLHAMAERVLAATADVDRMHLVMPNLHHLPVDLAPLGRENRNEIFVPTEEPRGVIEATVERG